MDSRLQAKLYLSELLDRVIRLDMHLGVVEDEFYPSRSVHSQTPAQLDNPLFLKSFRRCVDDLLHVVHVLARECEGIDDALAADTAMLKIRHGFYVLAQLHEDGLLHLPRPSEPTELKRFLRMIARHVLQRPGPDLAVYTTESTIESSFPEDPIETLRRTGGVSSLTRLLGILEPSQSTSGGSTSDSGIHVTIPRMDARNPLRWPSLIHEAAHKLISTDLIGADNIEEPFFESLPQELVAEIKTFGFDVRSWLTEAWCDLFAGLVVGPAFFFSQFSAFVSTPDGTLSNKYPPHSLRLFLIANCLRHRYAITQTAAVRDGMQTCLDLVTAIDRGNRLGMADDQRLKLLADSMRQFFMQHFFGGGASEAEYFRSKFEKMVRYVREIDEEQLNRAKESFGEGLPVPSKPLRGGAWCDEEPTSIQEVLLAAWLDRLERLLPACLAAIESTDQVARSREALVRPFEKFDSAVLRSLQIAEWLHVLIDPTGGVQASFAAAFESPSGGTNRGAKLLNDRGIAALIKGGDLRIVPMVNLDQQLGAASIDIRLGTSFEVYLPAYIRSDASSYTTPDAYAARSLDLDFLEHMVLLPGQMVLAHSFEYIRLPQYIGADLEGRSSYARLGLEIHLTAGMIDPGFEGTITFEMVNNGPNSIQLFPGLRIAQLRMSEVDAPLRPYSQRSGAKYSRQLHHGKSRHRLDIDYQRLLAAIGEQRSHPYIHRPSADDVGKQRAQ